MTRRERLKRCYFNQELDRPAVYSRASFPADDSTYDQLKSYLNAYTELKIALNVSEFESEYLIEVKMENYSEDFERRIDILKTPKGDLYRSTMVSLKGQPGMHEKYFVNCAEDAEKYLSLPIPVLNGNVLANFNVLDAEIGDKGIVDIRLGSNPGGFIADMCGSENFAIMSITDRDILHKLCERQMNIILQRVQFVLDAGVGPFFSMLGEEYIVPPLHGLNDFNDFNVKYDKPIIDLVHDAQGRMHIHSHGSIKSVFQGFIDMGADVLHPFEPPPQGNITAAEAKALAGGRMCLEGNIQINRLYEETPDVIRQETEQLIADAFGDSKGLIVCPTASPYIRGQGEICFPQYKAMIDTVINWNK